MGAIPPGSPGGGGGGERRRLVTDAAFQVSHDDGGDGVAWQRGGMMGYCVPGAHVATVAAATNATNKYDKRKVTPVTTPYLTTSQAARRLGLSRHTVLRAAHRGEIAVAHRTPGGRFRFEDAAVDAYGGRTRGDGAAPTAMEEALRASEELFRAIFEHAMDLVIVVEADGTIRYASPSHQRLLGYDPATLRGMNIADFAAADERPRQRTYLADVRRASGIGALVERRLRHADGSTRIVEAVTNNQLDNPAVRGLIVNARDITERVHAEEALRQSEERFRALSEHASDLVAITDAGGMMRYASPSYRRLLGYDPAALEGKPVVARIHPDDRPLVRERLGALMAEDGARGEMKFRARHADGSWRVIEAMATNRLHDPAVRGVISISRDVTARVRTEEALRANEERLLLVVANTPVILFALDEEGTYTLSEGKGLEALGRRPGEVVGRSVFDVYAHDPHLLEAVRQALAGAATSAVTEINGVVIDARHTPLVDDAGQVRGIIGVGADITARVRAEDALRHQALHDALTGLPNRTLLHDRLVHATHVAAREQAAFAVFLLDLDRFKEVNDTLGHAAGDALLERVAERLQGAVRASDTVARLGGDEFAVILPGVDVADATRAADKLLTSLAEPVDVAGQRLAAGGSLGIALYPDHGGDAGALLRHADIAMYAAKREGGGHAVYAPEMDLHTPHRLTLVSALRHAIADGQFRVHYQPIVDVTTGRVHLVEALARWQHPELGLLSPDQFIPLAEGTGLIAPLTHWVVEESLRQVRAWRDAGLDLAVAVNLSARALRDPALPDTVVGLLQAHGVPADHLRVELTESAVMADPAGALTILTRLAALGIRIAIDDFGTGYSSLSYLKRLPIDEIKIDRSFVTHMTRDGGDATIVASTIGLGHSLGLRFIAEGVESGDTWRSLEALGCDGIQGFYISRALPADELTRWLRGTTLAPAAPAASGVASAH